MRMSASESNGRRFYACPCCENFTLGQKPPGTFEICEVCGWEDDYLQFHDIDFAGGANDISLREAREIYRQSVEDKDNQKTGTIRTSMPRR